MRPNVRITTFPSEDDAFRLAVEGLLREQPELAPQGLGDRLRPLYPRVAIVRRQLSGESDWYYAFRDGRVGPVADDVWWTDPDTPVAVVSVTTGRLVRVTEEWATMMAGETRSIAGRHYTEFLPQEARGWGVALFESVMRTGTARSSIVVERADGTLLPIEFHAELHGDEIEVAYRRLAD